MNDYFLIVFFRDISLYSLSNSKAIENLFRMKKIVLYYYHCDLS